jgi:hypothetical protein
VQSVPITTKIVSLNPAHGEVYSIQLYVIMYVSDLWQVCGFLLFPPPIKLTATIYKWNIVESSVKHHNPNPFIKKFDWILCNSNTALSISYNYLHYTDTGNLEHYIQEDIVFSNPQIEEI